jgi:formyl-CoA transferase
MSITGEINGGPMKMGIAIVDICTGMYASNAILAALMARHRLGVGQRVEICLHDTGISMLSYVASAYLVDGQMPKRYGNGHPNIVPYRAYPTRDGQLVITVANDNQFLRFSELLGHEEWTVDPRFRRNRDRVENRDEIDQLICDELVKQECGYWINLLEAADIPCSRINSVPEALSSAQVAARELVVTADHPDLTDLKIPGIPFRFDQTPAGVHRHPPKLGEHTTEILREELQFTEQDIAELRARRVI